MKASMRRLVALGLCLTLASLAGAQVDPAWLRSWEEAWEARPEVLPNFSRFAAEDEPGTPLVIRGRVVRPDGSAAPDTIVHVYHRDDAGYDFGPGDRATSTWRLQGWVVTDVEGRFGFETIRPAPDALGREAAHLHFTLISESHGRQWATKIYFADDPLVPASVRERSNADGEFGSVREVRQGQFTQHIDVTFRLKAEGDF